VSALLPPSLSRTGAQLRLPRVGVCGVWVAVSTQAIDARRSGAIAAQMPLKTAFISRHS